VVHGWFGIKIKWDCADGSLSEDEYVSAKARNL